jgi:hypothetical protein
VDYKTYALIAGGGGSGPQQLRLADGAESAPLSRRVTLPCRLGRRVEEAEFLVLPEACQEVILGRDVLAAWGAVVDVGQEALCLRPRLGRAESAEALRFLPPAGGPGTATAAFGVPPGYPDVLPPKAFFDGKALGRARGVEHTIDTGDAPPCYEGGHRAPVRGTGPFDLELDT